MGSYICPPRLTVYANARDLRDSWMAKKMKSYLCLFLGLFVSSNVFAAGTAVKQTVPQEFLRGVALERSKNYSEAVSSFKTLLVAQPGYLWAEKELGNCYYYLGDYPSAVDHYNSYLMLNPSDVTAKSFADRLRNTPVRGEQRLPAAVSRHSGLFLTLDSGLVDGPPI